MRDFGGGEVPTSGFRGEDAMDFLGKRCVEIAGTQAGLDVAERNPLIENSPERRRERSSYLLAQNEIGTPFSKSASKRLQAPCQAFGQGLPRSGNLEVSIGLIPNSAKARAKSSPCWPVATTIVSNRSGSGEPSDHRSHFNRFRPCADNATDEPFFHVPDRIRSLGSGNVKKEVDSKKCLLTFHLIAPRVSQTRDSNARLKRLIEEEAAMLTTIARDTTKAKLLEAAGEEFADKGFEKATIRGICELAGANIAAVNYHFGDKEQLYARG